ncbi:MAG: ComEC/Rec2 family competence protein, partial [bacterium]|nr:ComEC/Rec2 family competence protein [bacterium]
RKNGRSFILVTLFVVTIFIWYAVLKEDRGATLKVAFLDIGQGDAIYIEAPNGNQMLVDGGPPRAVLSALRQVMQFYDRSIDMIMVTNPDKDHIGGFIDVLNSYNVGMVVEPGTVSSAGTYAEFGKIMADRRVPKMLAERGQVIWLDKKHGVGFQVLFPDRDISGLATNDGSIVGRLFYGSTSVMFTGDSPDSIEKYLVYLDGKNLKSDVLKVGHHGSRTSTSEEFVGFVSPDMAVISDGEGNSYGHPHKETLDTLEKFDVKVFRTDQVGTVVMKSDGENIEVR